MDGGIREGTPREVLIDSKEYEPSEGSKLAYQLSGRSGAVKMAGNRTMYNESNPHPGGFEIELSCDDTQFAALAALQTSRRFVAVAVTSAGDNLFVGRCCVANADPLKLDNGTVTVEMKGEFAKQ